jgi:hypothetical protein
VHDWAVAAGLQANIGSDVFGVVFPLAVAAVGWVIITDFRGFATWHRQQADASTPALLRRVSDNLVGRARNERATRVIQKIVGWAFLVLGSGMSLLILLSLIFS